MVCIKPFLITEQLIKKKKKKIVGGKKKLGRQVDSKGVISAAAGHSVHFHLVLG